MVIFGNDIADVAKRYIGIKEKPNNSGFYDADFQKAMEDIGWKKGYSWCVYFAKLVWSKSLQNQVVRAAAMKLINGNSQSTLRNFIADKSGMFTVSDTATPGAIVIFQNYVAGKPQTTGHAGIVTSAGADYFETIEGNTNSNGGREGIEVAKKKRGYNRAVINGLRLKKFITIKNG